MKTTAAIAVALAMTVLVAIAVPHHVVLVLVLVVVLVLTPELRLLLRPMAATSPALTLVQPSASARSCPLLLLSQLKENKHVAT